MLWAPVVVDTERVLRQQIAAAIWLLQVLAACAPASQDTDPRDRATLAAADHRPSIIADPQYILLFKSPTATNTCCRWDQRYPEIFNQSSIDEIRAAFPASGTSDRRLGVAFKFEPMSNQRDPFRTGRPELERYEQQVEASLRRLVDLAERNDLPIFVRIDTHRAWEIRSDLWNWWDPSLPGYNPQNVSNVEWSCWSATCATKASWQNWYGLRGSIAKAPAPNLASPVFREAVAVQLRKLVDILANWYRRLPPERKYLLAGVSPTAELAIGVSSYFCPNGNDHVGVDAPVGCVDSVDSVQIGYAAAHAGGVTPGTRLTPQILDRLVGSYAAFVTRLVYNRGIPRNKIFNHTFGHHDGHVRRDLSIPTGGAALTPYAAPSWSFYGWKARDPQRAPGLLSWLANNGGGYWGVLEWYPGAGGRQQWEPALEHNVSLDNQKVLVVNAWEGIKENPGQLAAVNAVLARSPSHWLDPPTITKISVSAARATIRWAYDLDASSVHLYVGTDHNLATDGTLRRKDILSQRVTGQRVLTTRTLAAGRYYVQVVSRTASRRVASAVSILSVH